MGRFALSLYNVSHTFRVCDADGVFSSEVPTMEGCRWNGRDVARALSRLTKSIRAGDGSDETRNEYVALRVFGYEAYLQERNKREGQQRRASNKRT